MRGAGEGAMPLTRLAGSSNIGERRAEDASKT